MASAAVFIGAPKTWHAALSVANANSDGSGTLVDLVAGGTTGSRVDRVRVQATGTTTAGKIRLFLQDGSSNKRMIDELLVDPIVPSTVQAAWSGEFMLDGLTIPNGWTLRASTHNAETFNIFAMGGDF